jgi:hypothetical protein
MCRVHCSTRADATGRRSSAACLSGRIRWLLGGSRSWGPSPAPFCCKTALRRARRRLQLHHPAAHRDRYRRSASSCRSRAARRPARAQQAARTRRASRRPSTDGHPRYRCLCVGSCWRNAAPAACDKRTAFSFPQRDRRLLGCTQAFVTKKSPAWSPGNSHSQGQMRAFGCLRPRILTTHTAAGTTQPHPTPRAPAHLPAARSQSMALPQPVDSEPRFYECKVSCGS